MKRRTLFRAALAGAAGLFAARAAAQAPSSGQRRQRVVYHLDELDRIATTMANLRNHVAGTGGPGGADIALVVTGPALSAFRLDRVEKTLASDVAARQGEGVAVTACGNTMAAMKLDMADLLPGMVKAERGGVVRLAELQGEGYAYIRP